MNERFNSYLVEEWITIRLWALPIGGMILGGLMPIIGFWVALVGYIFVYPVWKADPVTHKNLKVFALLAMILSFITMMSLIYLIALEAIEQYSFSLIAHIIKN